MAETNGAHPVNGTAQTNGTHFSTIGQGQTVVSQPNRHTFSWGPNMVTSLTPALRMMLTRLLVMWVSRRC
jgi:hypothetical protein